MNWFSQTGFERQLELYGEQMEVKQNQLDELDGVDTAESALRREQLAEELAGLEISREGIRSQMELQGANQAPDLFND